MKCPRWLGRTAALALALSPPTASAALVRIDFEGTVSSVEWLPDRGSSLAQGPIFGGDPVRGTVVYENDPSSVGVVDMDPSPTQSSYAGGLIRSFDLDLADGAYVARQTPWPGNEIAVWHEPGGWESIAFGVAFEGELLAGRLPSLMHLGFFNYGVDALDSDLPPTAAEVLAFPLPNRGDTNWIRFGTDVSIRWTLTAWTAVPEPACLPVLALGALLALRRPVS